MTSCKPQIMARLTPKTAMWFWLIFGGIFAAFGISTFLGAIGSVSLIRTLRFIVASCFLMLSGVSFRKALKCFINRGLHE